MRSQKRLGANGVFGRGFRCLRNLQVLEIRKSRRSGGNPTNFSRFLMRSICSAGQFQGVVESKKGNSDIFSTPVRLEHIYHGPHHQAVASSLVPHVCRTVFREYRGFSNSTESNLTRDVKHGNGKYSLGKQRNGLRRCGTSWNSGCISSASVEYR